ncbi:MAG: glutathione S-transferase family protein [Rhizobiaceae bacterium]|nr:glutathione S-transferase family protein [Rhizobiaceae bacterium]
MQFFFHPLASFCHKVLIALYEKDIAFEPVIVDLGDPEEMSRFRRLSPMGQIPVLVDEQGEPIGETSVIIEYLDQRFPQAPRLLPTDTRAALAVRYWDRFYDFQVEVPMQKIVTDRLRPEPSSDAFGVEQARAQLRAAYAVIDRQLSTGPWAAGEDFTMADCAAEPGLFYANTVEPIGVEFPHAAAYLDRLMRRPAVTRVLKEAAPYFRYFPMPVKPDIAMLA